MAKDRNTTKAPMPPERKVTETEANSTVEPLAWSGKWRFVLSLAIAIHVVAIFAEPFRFFTRSSQRAFSPDAGYVRGSLSAYIDFAYLHHGYFFFAPNPGPSHLISAQIGKVTPPSQPKEIVLPDKTVQWPRLYYHRHFMLSEFLHNSFAPLERPEEAAFDPGIDQQWRRDRELYVAVKSSIENRFRVLEKTDEVSIRRIEHALPNDIQVYQEKWKLNDPRLYIVLPESFADQEPALTPVPVPPPPNPSTPFPLQTLPGAEAVEGIP
jgi:hypothetical protein